MINQNDIKIVEAETAETVRWTEMLGSLQISACVRLDKQCSELRKAAEVRLKQIIWQRVYGELRSDLRDIMHSVVHLPVDTFIVHKLMEDINAIQRKLELPRE